MDKDMEEYVKTRRKCTKRRKSSVNDRASTPMKITTPLMRQFQKVMLAITGPLPKIYARNHYRDHFLK